MVASLLTLDVGISATVERFRGAMRDSGVVLDEQKIAELIVGILRPDTNKKWNLDVIASVLSEECKYRTAKIDWVRVVRFLDSNSLAIKSMDDFILLCRFFMRISGTKFPASGLIGNWQNKMAQLYMLILAANSPKADSVDFSSLVTIEQKIPDAPYPQNLSYLCLPLYNTLLELGGRGMHAQVLKTLSAAADMFPEYVTILLAQAQDYGTNIRGEILTSILVKFSGNQGSRPTSLAVQQTLLKVNPDLLVWLFRCSIKSAQTSMDIANVHGRMSAISKEISKRVDAEASPDELIGLWCVTADKSDFNLEAKVRLILQKQPNYAKPIAIFLRTQGPTLRGKSSDGAVLSYESFSIVMKVLSSFTNEITQDELRELNIFSQRYQSTNNNNKNMSRLTPGRMLNSSMKAGDDEIFKGSVNQRDIDEVEKESDVYFQKIYSNEIALPDAVQLFKRLKGSAIQRENEIFRCMVHNLFDEYRFFHKYNDKELELTGCLFGLLINNQLVSSITLGIALRYVLEALRKDPTQGGANEKMFKFGKMALGEFRGRLGEWPQYCSHLLQIHHFYKHAQQFHIDAKNALENPNATPAPAGNNGYSSEGVANGVPPKMGGSNAISGLGMQPTNGAVFVNTNTSANTTGAAVTAASLFNDSGNNNKETGRSSSGRTLVRTAGLSDTKSIIDIMGEVNKDSVDENTAVPAEALRDAIFFIINNIAQTNYQSKSEKLRGLLSAQYYRWFASSLVSQRISTQPNLHSLYLSVLDIIGSNDLYKVILDSTYHQVTRLLQSPNITSSSSERSLLRNLGMWLGQITLARNKPVLQRRIHLKELIFWGFETGRLIAVCSFVAKIIEGCKDSHVFRPPNPWLMATLGVLRDLYDTEELKMNIKFEIQVLCKTINIRVEDIPKAGLISQCKMPPRDGKNPDFNLKGQSGPPSGNSPSIAPTSSPVPKDGETKVADGDQLVIPNLWNYIVINPSIDFFAADPAHKRLVSLAVDRAIREVIQPVVDRSAHISCKTTVPIILKDFAYVGNEVQMRNAAHLMVSTMAGSLAMVTCKELLRNSIMNNLRNLLASVTQDKTTVDQIVQVCTNDNLNLGCALVEKAAMEKSTRDIDEQLNTHYQARKKVKESGQLFVDQNIAKENGKFPNALVDYLKPKPINNLSVYETFQRQRSAASSRAQMGANGEGQGPHQMQNQNQNQSPSQTQMSPDNTLSMAQALDAYQVVLQRMESSINELNTQAQAQGRELNMSMLRGDHDILGLLRDMIIVTQRTQAMVRTETAMTFAENLFKRMVDNPNPRDMLKLDVLIGSLEALRDACGGPKKFMPDTTVWLNRHTAFNVNDEMSRRMHCTTLGRLLRVKLLRSQEVDMYFASAMDGGRNMMFVELALSFVRQCLADGIAATYEFTSIFDTVSKMRPANAAVRKQLQKWLQDLRSLAASKEEQKAMGQGQGQGQGQQGQGQGPNMGQNPNQNQLSLGQNQSPGLGPGQSPNMGQGGSPQMGDGSGLQGSGSGSEMAMREHVTLLLDRWLRVWSATNDQILSQYLQLINQYGVLKTEESADKFFKMAAELCIQAFSKIPANASNVSLTESKEQSPAVYTVIDALSKLFLFLVHLAEKEGGSVQLLTRILNAIVRVLMEDHEAKRMNKIMFDQRPYYRLISSLLQDIGNISEKGDPSAKDLSILNTYSQIFMLITPAKLPGFAFGWLQLISNRCFMPQLLLVKGQKGWPHMHRLLLSLMAFLQPFLKSAQVRRYGYISIS